ncbi:carboxylesterase family protein [Gammaproteobacteria bacterium]|nr:carboxylesterase family protein [Gammaproteobacteria bacterium]
MRRREFLGTVSASILAGTLMGCSAGEKTLKGPTLQSPAGQIRGQIVDQVHRFLGIPYAEAPFGKNRFVAPVARAPWEGIFEADDYGLICPQTGGGVGIDSFAEGEDCLNLNIWTPDPAAKGLPVMVWAHGGGQISGTGASAVYDGTHFAKEGVVLVTNNRRLGAEGYLYLPELFGDGIGPGNLGILDQIEVLRWVQENIESFGGDPNNVTLFGESGGGAATQAVVATPESAGLLHRVIPQSGGHAAQRPNTATQIARMAIDRVDIKPGDLDALRSLHWSAFPKIYDELQIPELGQPQTYLPVLGEDMPVHPVDASHQGVGLDLDYLIGTCRDEARLFTALGMEIDGSQFGERAQTLARAAGADWGNLIAAYKKSRPELDDDEAKIALVGDAWFRLPSIRIAEGHAQARKGNTFMYLFEWESQLIGAAHALDLAVFGNGMAFPGLAGFKSSEKVGTLMRKAWVNFARRGDPSIEGFKWPEYDLENRHTVSINELLEVLADPYRLQREAFGEALTMNWQQKKV